MKEQNDKKLFAFKLAEKKKPANTQVKWKAKNGVATAGCTGPDARFRDPLGGNDQGIWC